MTPSRRKSTDPPGGREGYVQKQYQDDAPIWNKQAAFLGKLTLELTERCNNNCIHCCINRPAHDDEARRRELSTTEVKDILGQAAALGCLKVTLTGGEPLLREDFREIYLHARKLGMQVVLFTNATLITPDLVELFKRIPPRREIEITVYGMERDSYEAVSGKKGTFDLAWRGIRLLEENGIPFVVKTVELPQNRRDLEAFRRWGAGIPWMSQQEPMVYKFFGFRLRRDDDAKNARIRNLRADPEKILDDGEGIKDIFLAAIRKFSMKVFKPQGNRLFFCHAGKYGAMVDAYGKLQLCILLRHPDTLFDLRHGSLREGYRTFMPRVRRLRARNPEYMRRCAVCFLKIVCQQCPGQSWIEHGDLDTPVEYICAITHTKARYAGILGEREKAWEVRDGQERMARFAAGEGGGESSGTGGGENCGGLD